jgi:cell division protein ZapA
MSDAKPVSVKIFDKEYVVACPDDERDSLYAAVDFVNARMHEVKDGSNVIGSERIAVMAALNIAHEYLDYKARNDNFAVNVDAVVRRMQSKISGVLTKNPG